MLPLSLPSYNGPDFKPTLKPRVIFQQCIKCMSFWRKRVCMILKKWTNFFVNHQSHDIILIFKLQRSFTHILVKYVYLYIGTWFSYMLTNAPKKKYYVWINNVLGVFFIDKHRVRPNRNLSNENQCVNISYLVNALNICLWKLINGMMKIVILDVLIIVVVCFSKTKLELYGLSREVSYIVESGNK